jgi:hypothetical protein
MKTILESIRAMTTRQQAQTYLADKPGTAIKDAYAEWLGRKAPTVGHARRTLINIAGAVADRDAILGTGR